jgi:hypothetical protein
LPAGLAPAVESLVHARQGGVDLLDEPLFTLHQAQREFLLKAVTAEVR